MIIPEIRHTKQAGILPGSENNTGKKSSIDFTAPLITLKGLETVWLPYLTALELVARIDEDLTRGRRHYRNRGGLLLTCLDEVVEAIIAGNLLEA
jgi:hypothetical protein